MWNGLTSTFHSGVQRRRETQQYEQPGNTPNRSRHKDQKLQVVYNIQRTFVKVFKYHTLTKNTQKGNLGLENGFV